MCDEGDVCNATMTNVEVTSASAACDVIDQLATTVVTSDDLLWDNHNFEQACNDVSELVSHAQRMNDDDLITSAVALKQECARAAIDEDLNLAAFTNSELDNSKTEPTQVHEMTLFALSQDATPGEWLSG